MSSGSGGVYSMRLLILITLDSCTIPSTVLDFRCMVQVEAIYTLATPVGIVLAGVMRAAAQYTIYGANATSVI